MRNEKSPDKKHAINCGIIQNPCVLEALASSQRSQDGQNSEESDFTDAALYDIGFFYLLCLEDPSRFKVGFASNLNERLRQHRCSAPYTQVVKTWPCRRLWEKTAIECVTDGCERLHTEVFRSQSLESVEQKCERFFTLMPQLSGRQSAELVSSVNTPDRNK